MTFSSPSGTAHRPSLDADLAHVAPALGGGRALLLSPVAPATWRAVSQATVGFPVLLFVGILVLVLTPLSIGLVLLGVGLPMLALTLTGARLAGHVELRRLTSTLDVDIPSPAPVDPRGLVPWAGWRRTFADTQSWASVGYFATALLLNAVQVAVAWSVGGALMLVLTHFSPWADDAGFGLVWLPVLGLVSPWLWATASQGLALLHIRLARVTLGPTTRAVVAEARAATERAEQEAAVAQERAVHLDETRTRAVSAADDDRRRIERDLHDGAQQRLVALGVELGVAKRLAAKDPDAAAAALEHAHLEIKETLTELRDLVRGIHPAVLTDRGLDAALSALAARHPVPVTVTVPDVAAVAGTSPGAQAAAYFVTAEALTNSARHSGASAVEVTVDVALGRLRLQILDDGLGGAHAAPGGGLDGLRSRVEALDGTFTVDSPAGHGTRLVMEVPCAS